MLKPRKEDAIISLVGGSIRWTDESDEIEYLSGQTAPTQSAIDTKLASLNAEWTAQSYSRNRQAEYPSNGDQWDMIYKDNKNGTTTHADAVEVVKTKWPKDNTGPVE